MGSFIRKPYNYLSGTGLEGLRIAVLLFVRVYIFLMNYIVFFGVIAIKHLQFVKKLL